MFGSVRFYESCHKEGIKPILGCDLWITNEEDPAHPFRLTVYCMDHDGYHSLCVLLTRAWLENQCHVKGRGEVKESWLAGEGTKGLIGISGGPEGEIQTLFRRGKTAEAEAAAEKLAHFFPDRFYLDLQRAGRPGDEAAVRFLCNTAAKLELPVVATHPVQFQKKEDFIAHEVRVCIAEGYTLADPKRPKRYTEDQYLKSPEEMMSLFADIPSAIENTVEIAKRCNVDDILSKPQLPLFETPKGMSLDDYIDHLAHDGLEERLEFLYPDEAKRNEVRPRYLERLEYELSIIKKMKFPGYFLIVQEFINWSKTHGVPVGPGRGSGAGSLVAYSLRITDMDPLHYNLLFERFLNPERVSMPDFDVDFCQWNRDKTIQHVKDKYGASAVSQIATFGAMGAKAVVRDVGRVLGMPYGKVDELAKLIPAPPGQDVTLELAKEMEPDFKKKIDGDEQYQELMRYAEPLEGITRNLGMHAGGVLIAPGPLTNFCPLYNQDGQPENTISQFDKHDVENVGLVKFDFLGLTTLTILNKCVEYINKLHPGQSFELRRIPTDDPATLKLFQDGDTTAVFQFESPGMRQLLRQAHPDRIEDLVALNALYRPGPMEMIPTYLARKSGKEPVTYLDDRMGSVLAETYGIMVYQEQVLEIVRTLAGYSLGKADSMRRVISKKKADQMVIERKNFIYGSDDGDIPGCIKNGIDEQTAISIFDEINDFANYAFNKSHAAAYAFVTYQTAYLKTFYPVEYMASLISSIDDLDKINHYIANCKEMGIDRLPPDVNKSEDTFTVENNSIRFGLSAVKNVGRAMILNLVNERKNNGEFKNFSDFIDRMAGQDMNKRALEGLISCGAFDSMGVKRSQLLAVYEKALDGTARAARDNVAGQMSLFDTIEEQSEMQFPNIDELDKKTMLKMEKQSTGLYFSGHPMEEYTDKIKKLTKYNISDVLTSVHKDEDGNYHAVEGGLQDGDMMIICAAIASRKNKTTRSNAQMAFLNVEDVYGSVECIVFPKVLNEFSPLLQEDNLVAIACRLSIREDEAPKILMQSVQLLDEALMAKKEPKRLYIQLETRNDENLKNVEKYLSPYQGDMEVRLFFKDTRKMSSVPRRLWFNGTENAIYDLKNIFGEDNVKIK